MVPYLIVVLACHAGAGLAWVSGSDCCHWTHLLLMGIPHPLQNPVPLFCHHLILNSIVGVAGLHLEVSPSRSVHIPQSGRKKAWGDWV